MNGWGKSNKLIDGSVRFLTKLVTAVENEIYNRHSTKDIYN